LGAARTRLAVSQKRIAPLLGVKKSGRYNPREGT